MRLSQSRVGQRLGAGLGCAVLLAGCGSSASSGAGLSTSQRDSLMASVSAARAAVGRHNLGAVDTALARFDAETTRLHAEGAISGTLSATLLSEAAAIRARARTSLTTTTASATTVTTATQTSPPATSPTVVDTVTTVIDTATVNPATVSTAPVPSTPAQPAPVTPPVTAHPGKKPHPEPGPKGPHGNGHGKNDQRGPG